ncbi:hypothetical protein B621_gp15 [Marinomonas phage P12026]|nr:hypothetical protein B621_gp15 [Marinomonas phage P12026]AFM54861.1 hypothetical protein P12026_15 [Marinomonas phage P12026]
MTVGEIYSVIWAKEKIESNQQGGLSKADKSRMLNNLRNRRAENG